MRALVTLLVATGCGFSGAMATDGAPPLDSALPDGLDADPDPDAPTTVGAWWNDEYLYRAPITITAGANAALVEGYSVVLVANTKVLVDAGRVLPTGRDWRIVRRSVVAGVVTWTELDRWIEDVPGRDFDQEATRTWFRLPAAVAAETSDSDTFVYYGAPSIATMPPHDPSRVFLFADDFDGDLTKWTENGRGEMVRTVNERAAGTKGLEVKPGSTPAAGLHVDLELPRTPVMFMRWLRQGQTNASFGDARAFEAPYADRSKAWTESSLRLPTEIDSGDRMQVWAANNALNNWFQPVGQNTWHELETIFDSVANTVRCRANGGAFTAPIDSRYIQDSPIRSFALEGEGQSGTFWVDNFIIRHSVTPEPMVTRGEEEAQP